MAEFLSLPRPFGFGVSYHTLDAFAKCDVLDQVAECGMHLVVIGISVHNFIPSIEEFQFLCSVEFFANDCCEFLDCIRGVCPDVKDLVIGFRSVDGLGYDGCDIVDVTEGAGLHTIAKDGQLLALHDLVHEDADNIAIRITDILPLAIDIVWAENHVVESKHLVGTLQVELHGQFGNAIRVFRHGHHVFLHGKLIGAIYRYTGREDKTLHCAGIDRGIDEVDASDEVVLVIKPSDEVA